MEKSVSDHLLIQVDKDFKYLDKNWTLNKKQFISAGLEITMGTLSAYCMHVCVVHGTASTEETGKEAFEDRTRAARLSSKHMYFQSHLADSIMGIAVSTVTKTHVIASLVVHRLELGSSSVTEHIFSKILGSISRSTYKKMCTDTKS